MSEREREVSVKHTIYSHAFQKRNYTFQVLMFTLTHKLGRSLEGIERHLTAHRPTESRTETHNSEIRVLVVIVCLRRAQRVRSGVIVMTLQLDDTKASSTGLDINKGGYTSHRMRQRERERHRTRNGHNLCRPGGVAGVDRRRRSRDEQQARKYRNESSRPPHTHTLHHCHSTSAQNTCTCKLDTL